MTDLAIELQKIYDSEINLRISWFWDNGFDLRFRDEMNGYLAEENVATVAGFFPGSWKPSRISTRGLLTPLR
jgi:hypothetical protein